jgi:hypothetical protein
MVELVVELVLLDKNNGLIINDLKNNLKIIIKKLAFYKIN